MVEIEDLVEEFVDHYGPTKSYSVTKSYEYAAEMFAEWFTEQYDGDLAELDDEDVERFVYWMVESTEYAKSTVDKRYKNFTEFCDYLVKNYDFWDESPTVEFEPYAPQGPIPKGYTEQAKHLRQEIHYIEPDEFEKLLSNVPEPKTRNELMLRLMWQTGVRQKELTEIRLTDISRDEQNIRIKNAKTPDQSFRTVYYHDNVERFMMDEWLQDRESYPTRNSPYLFITPRNEQMYHKRPNKVVRKAAKRAGIQEELYTDAKDDSHYKITSHALRHSFAVHSVREEIRGGSIDIRTLQELMGHESIETTAVYLKFKKDTIRDRVMNYGPQ